MGTLQRAVREAPALRDLLPVAALNALSETCQELHDTTWQGTAYRDRYVEMHQRLNPQAAAFYPSAAVMHPGANFRRALRGMSVHRAQMQWNPPPLTRADAKAQTYYLAVTYPPAVAARELALVKKIQAWHRADVSSLAFNRKVWCDAAVGISLGVAVCVGLFLYSAAVAAIVVLSFLAARYLPRTPLRLSF